MKLITVLVALLPFASMAQVGIGTTSPDASAALDVTATDKGVLVPRVTTTQRNAVSSPATGLLVFNTSNNQFEFFDGGAWLSIAGTAYSAGTGIDIYSDVISVSNSVVTSNYLGAVQVASLNTTGVLTGSEIRISSLSSAQIAALTGQTAGRIVYQNDGDQGIYVYNGSAWISTTGWTTNDGSPASSFSHSNPASIQSTANANYGVGVGSLVSLTTGDNNTALGYDALGDVSGGLANSAIGYQALSLTTGSNNSAIGKSAGTANTSGSNNTFIGAASNAASSGLSNATALGYGAEVSASNSIQLGNGSVTSVTTSGTLTATGGLSTSGSITTSSGQLGIGTASPASSAALEISSTNQGLLLPRMTTAQRSSITTPEAGLLIYNTTTNKAQVYSSATTSWLDYSTSNNIALAVNSTTSISQTFSAPTSESLEQIRLNVYTFPSAGSVTATIYDGSGTTGTNLGSTSTSISTTGSVNFTFATPIPVTSGSTYTIHLTATGGTSIQFWADNANPYSSGGVIGVSGITAWDLDMTLLASGTWINLH
jgi:hypothetical protein